LGAYLESCGAVWGDALDVKPVVTSADGLEFRWEMDMPPDLQDSLRAGDCFESPPFALADGGRARFRLCPKGEGNRAEDLCALWLITDRPDLGPLTLRVGNVARQAGAADFCSLQDAVSADGVIHVSLQLQAPAVAPGESMPPSAPALQQSLNVTNLQFAEWRIFQATQLVGSSQLVTSPPFRMHHVLLGDMYLELLPGSPVAGQCRIFFRCRVPTMRLSLDLDVGGVFSKNLIVTGKSTHEEDIKSETCLQVNLEAPGVLGKDDTLTVRCSLDKVVSIPPALQDMIPQLDERALWPKRL